MLAFYTDYVYSTSMAKKKYKPIVAVLAKKKDKPIVAVLRDLADFYEQHPELATDPFLYITVRGAGKDHTGLGKLLAAIGGRITAPQKGPFSDEVTLMSDRFGGSVIINAPMDAVYQFRSDIGPIHVTNSEGMMGP